MTMMDIQDFNRILQKLPFGYHTLDENGFILTVNDNWLNLMGYDDKEEVIGKKITHFLIPEELDKFETNFSLFKQKGEIHINQYELIKKDGTHIFASEDGIASYDEHGKFLQCHCFLRDITNEIKTKQRIRKTRERAELYLNLAGVIIVALNKDGIIILMNKKGYEVLEFEEGELLGKNWFTTCIPPQLRDQVYDVFKSLMNGEVEPMEFFENSILTKNDEEKIIAWHNTLIYDDNGDINGTISAGEDVTRLNNLRTELLDRASHELKTPLVSIRGNTELLLTYHKDEINPKLLPIIENINRNSIRLQTLISHILNASALEAGLVFVNKTTNDLSALIQECVKDLQGLTIQRNLKITLNLHKELITSFDYRKIKNVVDNLLINAIKYTPLNGKIVIQSEIFDDSLLVSIRDNGIGLTEEEKSSIFKHFGKIERYGKGWDIEIEGAGLGLFISKGIIKLHKGKIWAVSEGRLKGTKFSFTLPKL
jgi:two-component system phosphate regulon sensor histidine kinase PhoR